MTLAHPALAAALATAALLCGLPGAPAVARPQTPDEGLPAAAAGLFHEDARLAATVDRLATANAALCRRVMPAAGFALHSRDQYADRAAEALFEGGDVAVLHVVPGSPADIAGLMAGDVLLGIGGSGPIVAEAGTLARDAWFAKIAAQPPTGPLGLEVRRAGAALRLSVPARPACRVLAEVVTEAGFFARTDGRVMQLAHALVAAIDDAGLAVIVAHELAHVALEHRRRLEAAGASGGVLGEIGASQQRNREAEVEADRLSAHLLANAGLDPLIAARFWRSAPGRRAGGGLLRSRVYPSPEARAAIIEREVAAYLAGAARSWPGHLLALRGD